MNIGLSCCDDIGFYFPWLNNALGVELLGHTGKYIFNYEICQTLLKVVVPIFIPTSQCIGTAQLFYFLSSTWKYHSSLILAIVTTCKKQATVF